MQYIFFFVFEILRSKCIPYDCNKHGTLSCIQEFFIIHHIYIYIKQSVSFLKFRGKTLRTQGRGGNTLDKTIVKKKIKSRETKKSKEMFNVYASFYLYPVAIIQVFVCIITLNSGEAYKGFLKHFQTFFLSGNWLPLLKHLK